jgi:hypothetical protein
MFNSRNIIRALAAAGVLFISSQAIAQNPGAGPNVTVVNTPLPVTVTNPFSLMYQHCSQY